MSISIGSPAGLGGLNAQGLIGQLESKFEQADADKNGSIGFEEAQAISQNDARVERLFAKFDGDGNGELSAAEQSAAIERISSKLERLSGIGNSGAESLQQLLNQIEGKRESETELLTHRALSIYQAQQSGE